MPAVTTCTTRAARPLSPLTEDASSTPPKNKITPRTGAGNKRNSVDTEDDERAAGSGTEPDVTGHAARAPTHRNAAHRRGGQVHQPVVHGERTNRDPGLREEMIVFIHRRDDRVAQRERRLGHGEEQNAGCHVAPRKVRDVGERQAKARRQRQQVVPERRVERESHERHRSPAARASRAAARDRGAGRLAPRRRWRRTARSP